MTALQELGMQRVVDKQLQSRPPLPLQINFRPIRQTRTRNVQSSNLAAQSSGLTSSVELGPAEEQATSSSQDKTSSIEQVSLESQVDLPSSSIPCCPNSYSKVQNCIHLLSKALLAGEDYTQLLNNLRSGEFEKADDETRALLIRLAGPDAVKRGWVYFTEVKFIPEADLQTIDALWRAASGGKFGYSIQKELWLKSSQRWDKFFQQIDWVQGENNNYRKWPKEFTYSTKAARGHLPLTNCLRGTQLFKAVMEHPAFIKADKSGNGSGKPSWLDDSDANSYQGF